MASLRIQLTDAGDKPLSDHVVVHLFPQTSLTSLQAEANIVGSIQINGIDASRGPYRAEVVPANYRPVQGFVSLSDGGTAQLKLRVPIDPARVDDISAPAFAELDANAQEMLLQAQSPRFNDGQGGYLQGDRLYSALDGLPLLKACFLNIAAKAGATALASGRRVIEGFEGLLRLEQDRLFLVVSPWLVEETAHSNAFHPVSPVLHDPLPGYKIGQSFKTFDRYGNLQLTFQQKQNAAAEFAVDVDIDDAQGIEHLFQLAHNAVLGPTNPYDIHDILLQQKPRVTPGYGFVFAAKAAVG